MLLDERRKIVVISASRSIAVMSIMKGLETLDVLPVYAGGEVKSIELREHNADLFLLCINDDYRDLLRAIMHLEDLQKETNCNIMLIGQKSENEDLKKEFPDLVFEMIMKTPIDSSEFILTVGKFLKSTKSESAIKKILILDDDPAYAKMVREWLREAYKTYVVTSGMQAISFLAKNSVDLILLDYDMPIVNGPQVLEMLRNDESTAHIPVFFLTGVSQRESIEKVVDLKPEGYILKSVTKEQLLEWVTAFFEKTTRRG